MRRFESARRLWMEASKGVVFFVYVLRFLRDGRHYVGSTNDLKRRLSEHLRGHVMSTRNRGPFELVHVERYETETEARQRERFLKTGRGREELKRILALPS